MLKEIIENFSDKKCSNILKLLLRSDVHIKYRKGQICIDGKIFEGVLKSKYSPPIPQAHDYDSDPEDKISKISRDVEANIDIGSLNRRTSMKKIFVLPEEKKNQKYQPRTDEGLIKKQLVFQSVDLLTIPVRSSLKVNFAKVKQDILNNNRFSERLSFGRNRATFKKGVNFGLRETFKTIKSKSTNFDKNCSINQCIDSLEKEDIIEIAIQYLKKSLDDDKLFSLIKTIYCDDEEIRNRIEIKYKNPDEIQLECFSSNLYHLLIYYNKIDIFEACFEIELIFGGSETSLLLLDCISYCIRTNHMMVLFHILMRYTDEVVPIHSKIINLLLEDINEYTETDGSSHYHSGIHYFEEKLFLLETLVESTSKEQAQKFIKVSLALLKVYVTDEELKSKTNEDMIKEIQYRVNVLIKK